MIAIKTYGLLWERKYIHWGWQGKPGHLKGYCPGFKEVDFREQRGLYVLYDNHMKPVYVGQTGRGQKSNLFKRLYDHDIDHLWNRWDYFSWFGLCSVNKDGSLHLADRADRAVTRRTSNVLDEIEGILIHVVEPPKNKQGARWKNVKEFYQFIDPDVEEPTQFDLHKELKEIKNQIRNLQGKPKR